jgi:hypothetical protein
MGWSGGSALFSEVITVIKKRVSNSVTRQVIYSELIPAFESFDADTLEECKGEDPAFNKAWKEYCKKYGEQ